MKGLSRLLRNKKANTRGKKAAKPLLEGSGESLGSEGEQAAPAKTPRLRHHRKHSPTETLKVSPRVSYSGSPARKGNFLEKLSASLPAIPTHDESEGETIGPEKLVVV